MVTSAVVVLGDTLAQVAMEVAHTAQALRALAVAVAAAPVIPFAFHVPAGLATMVALAAEVLVY